MWLIAQLALGVAGLATACVPSASERCAATCDALAGQAARCTGADRATWSRECARTARCAEVSRVRDFGDLAVCLQQIEEGCVLPAACVGQFLR